MSTSHPLKIRQAKPSDIGEYTRLMQTTYQHSLTNDEIDLTADCFSEEVFNTQDSQNYLKSHLINSSRQKTWLAIKGKKMVGAITATLKDKDTAELSAFYVLPEFQNQGIGKRLYQTALDFAGSRDLVLDIYVHNSKSINMYLNWGWELDTSRCDGGYFYRHWDEWPDDLQVKSMYMLKRNRV